MAQEKLCGKLRMTAKLCLETGLHIGGSDEFAPIGAVDSAVIRDPYTKEPIIPGSSLKGKIRSLLRRNQGGLNLETESPVVKRLFGTADKQAATPARLQFLDIHMDENSVKAMEQMEMDTYLGEIKFENSINALTGEANPRQIERVPAGAVFTSSRRSASSDRWYSPADLGLFGWPWLPGLWEGRFFLLGRPRLFRFV